jgi:hypothetical protein
LKNAIELQLDNDIEKQHGYFLSTKGYRKEGRTVGANFEDKLYVGNIHRIESHLYYEDEELADDDQIINVVVVDGPITRDGGGCSYGSKDWRDQATKYVVYRFAQGEKQDLNDPTKICAITEQTFFKLPYENGKEKTVYVVTALNRLQNESKGVKKKIRL